MVAQIIDKKKAKFRLIIREIETGKSKTLSLTNTKTTLNDLYNKLIDVFTPKEKLKRGNKK